jgi:hypothetical protein
MGSIPVRTTGCPKSELGPHCRNLDQRRVKPSRKKKSGFSHVSLREDNTDPTFCKNASIHYNIYNAMHIQFGSDKWARSKFDLFFFVVFLCEVFDLLVAEITRNGRLGCTTPGFALAESIVRCRRIFEEEERAVRLSCRTFTTRSTLPWWT